MLRSGGRYACIRYYLRDQPEREGPQLEPPLVLTVPDMAALRQGDMTLSFFSLCYVLSGDSSAAPAQRPVNRSVRQGSAGIPRTPVSRQILGRTAGSGGIVSAYGRRPVLNFHRHDKSKVISVSLSKSMPMRPSTFQPVGKAPTPAS